MSSEWQRACLRRALREQSSAKPGTLKYEIDAREKYERDKTMLFAWRTRLACLKVAQEVAMRLDEDFAAYQDLMEFRDRLRD